MVAPAASPAGLAIVVCDQIIEDKRTNKKSLIGIFNHIAASSFPCQHPRLAVFVAVTEGRGRYGVRLRIVHEETSEVIVELDGEIHLTDVTMVADLNFDLLGVVFPDPGLYSIEFYCEDALLLERRFQVTKADAPPGSAAAEP